MTDRAPTEREPRTAAGRALLQSVRTDTKRGDWPRGVMLTGILAIEEEAAASPPATETGGLPEHLRGDGPCDDCGTLDNIGWFTENVLWNAVTGDNVVHEQPRSGILCIPCFIKQADSAGLHPTGWRLLAEWPWRFREHPLASGADREDADRR